jgi:hypothetical protein
VCLELDDVDVDIASFERLDSSPGINRVLILVNLKNIVQLVWPGLITTKIVEVEPVGFAALASHNSDALYVAARKLAGQELKWRSTEICTSSVGAGVCCCKTRLCQHHQVALSPKA